MRIFLFILFCLISCSVVAQQPSSRTDLEKQRQSIMESIKMTQDQLEITRKNKTASLSELRALQSKLSERQKLINNINQEIGAINRNIQHSSNEISGLRRNLGELKIRYAQSLRFAYKNRSSYNMLAFLFSSADFNEAIRRLKYLKKYRDYRKDQAEQIRVTQTKIEKKLDQLNTEKSEKDVLKSAEEQQRLVIQKETNEKDLVVKDLKGRETALSAEIERNRKASRQLDAAINKIIQREIELARKKAEEEERKRREEEQRKAQAASSQGISVVTGSGVKSTTLTNNAATSAATKPIESNEKPIAMNVAKPTPARPTASTPYVSTLTPEAAALSNDFENNRGKLPWPVEKGYISQGFGKYTHPTEQKVTLENNGVDITTNLGSTARAVFDGSVTKVFFIPGANWNVMVNHGAFFTVYSGLEKVSVKADQKITTKQTIGTVGANDDGESVLNFQIWKVGRNNQFAKVDPAQWIAR